MTSRSSVTVLIAISRRDCRGDVDTARCQDLVDRGKDSGDGGLGYLGAVQPVLDVCPRLGGVPVDQV
jgi:hypothetical protein